MKEISTGGKRIDEETLVEELEDEMVDVSGTVGWIGSEYGEKIPCHSSFDYYIIVLEDCRIRADDGRKFRKDTLKVRCSRERYRSCRGFLGKSRRVSLRGRVKGEGEEIQELTQLKKKLSGSTHLTVAKPEKSERKLPQLIRESKHGTKKEGSKPAKGSSKKPEAGEKWPDMPPPLGFEDDFRREERKALEWEEVRIPGLFKKMSRKFPMFKTIWGKGKETPMFKEAKKKILKANMTPEKYFTLELMASRWVPKRDPENLNKWDGVGLKEISEKITNFPKFPHKDYRGIIDEILIPLQRSGFCKVFDPPEAEHKRNAITDRGLRFLYPKMPHGKDERGKNKVTTGLIHRLRVCGGARVLARKGFFFYPVFHWVSKHEFGEWAEPDGFAIPPAWTWRSVKDSWVWSRALWVEVLGEPIRREKIRANVEKNIKQNRRTLFLATSLKNGRKIAEESRSVLEKMTPVLREEVAKGDVTVGTRKIAPSDYVVIQPIPPILPDFIEKGDFKNFRQKTEIAKAVVDGREVKIDNVSEDEYLKVEGMGERSKEYVKIKKPDGQWTTEGRSGIVIEGFIKSINEGRIDPKGWADAKAPPRWFVDAFLLEYAKRKERQKFGAGRGDEIQIGDLTFDRDKVEKDYARLKDGELNFNRHVYRKYRMISKNRGA